MNQEEMQYNELERGDLFTVVTGGGVVNLRTSGGHVSLNSGAFYNNGPSGGYVYKIGHLVLERFNDKVLEVCNEM